MHHICTTVTLIHTCTTHTYVWVYAQCTHICTTYVPLYHLQIHAPHICTTVTLIHALTNIYGCMHHVHTHAPHMYHCTTYTCITHVPLYHLYIHAPQNTTKKKIRVYLVGLPSVLCKRPNAKGRSVLNRLFLMISGAFHVLFTKSANTFQTLFTVSFWVITKYRSFIRKTNQREIMSHNLDLKFNKLICC